MKTIKNNIAIFQGDKNNKHSIIFVHGFPFDHKMWDEVVEKLSPNYNCVTFDIRGLGESPAGDGQFTIEMFVDDIEMIIDELKLNKPILCGLSMGGYISLRAVERIEEKFSAVILCDTKSQADDNAGKIKRVEGIKAINKFGVEKFVEEFIQNCFAETSIKKLGKKYLDILDRAKSYSPLGVKGCLLAMAGRTDTSDYLSKIKIPVLLLCGEKDKLTPPAIMKEMAEKVSNFTFTIISNSAHMTPVENPEAVFAEIKKFLAEKL